MLGARPENAPGRGSGDRPAQHLLASWRPPGPEVELVTETSDLHDHIVDRASIYALAGEQALHVPVTSGREQKMFGVDRGMTQHARLVIGQQDRVVCLVGKPAQRLRWPCDREAGIFAPSPPPTPRTHER